MYVRNSVPFTQLDNLKQKSQWNTNNLGSTLITNKREKH